MPSFPRELFFYALTTTRIFYPIRLGRICSDKSVQGQPSASSYHMRLRHYLRDDLNRTTEASDSLSSLAVLYAFLLPCREYARSSFCRGDNTNGQSSTTSASARREKRRRRREERREMKGGKEKTREEQEKGEGMRRYKMEGNEEEEEEGRKEIS